MNSQRQPWSAFISILEKYFQAVLYTEDFR